ncbi:MAG: aminopeptidase [Halococcoides sp.]
MTDHGDRLRGPAETAIDQCMGLAAGESCLVVTDDERRAIGEALRAVAADRTDAASMLTYPPGDQHGEEPPAPVGAAMAAADVVIAPTTKSISHTRAREAACEAGARIATLPGITESVFRTGLDADYGAIADACDRIYDAVAGAEEIHVSTARGTDVTVRPMDREWHRDTGIVHDPGDFSNLPAGEVFVSPAHVEGRIVVDGTMMPHGAIDDPITIDVTAGTITYVDDAALREELDAAADRSGDGAFNLAEFGIGTNAAVTDLVGSVLLDEKAAGTVHFAIGDDASIGGDTEAAIHLDGIVCDPTVTVDGTPLELPSTE